MPSFIPSLAATQSVGAEGNNDRATRVSEHGTLDQSGGFYVNYGFNSTNPLLKSSSEAIASDSLRFGAYSKNPASVVLTPEVRVGSVTVVQLKGQKTGPVSLSSGQLENWEESAMADNSPRTDTSTDVDTDDRNQRFDKGQAIGVIASDSSDRSKGKAGDQKTLRRLAQNREAARKSRLRKKAYVQQLENSRLKLTQLEQELQRARQQGIFISSSGDQSHSVGGNGALAFDIEYARWLEEHNRQINELRAAVNAHAGDSDLRIIVDGVTAHFDEIFRLKGIAAKADVFHMLSGMWKTPAERCFLWLGGFRSSELLKLLVNQLEPLTEQQVVGLCNLQQSSQQAEDALSQGMEALQQSLGETLAGSLGSSGSSGNVANYMGQMAMAMGKLGTLENFLHQADNLRQQTLQQMHRILTTRQSARALLAINDYFSRLRALSSLWLARPHE
ncbi:transcription factor TGA2.2-like isoform X1 [Phalaenopsis equestris]|uniref:transcription factor TGA2.2-like isoform X1 n=1 Tax=Phalaenopsis equestris TaxID=78828 RepID=UPI0009E499A3|nr:transcription factor TGA2.2-like isoform X1 [Phalaenopsis equestris]XP_020583009.1 transcription factor TGA2.2-like isoform X1 [Phalaenopsis equestris]